MSQEEKLMSYIRGFRKGVTGSACSDSEMAIRDFVIGNTKGRAAMLREYKSASQKYGAELNPLRKEQP